MKFKKLTALFLMATLAAGMLAGCGKGKKATVLEDDESEPYEIVMYYLTGGKTDDIKMVQDKMNEYLTEKINATIKLYPFGWGDIDTKISNAIAAGEQVDVAFVNGSKYSSNVYNGSYLAIDDLMDKYAPKTKKLLGEEFIKGAMIDGKLYAVQANKDKGHRYVIQYRKDLADQYGIDMSGVKTFDDMFDVFEQVKNKISGIYPFGLGIGTTPTVLEPMYTVDSFLVMIDKEGKSDTVYNMYETEEYLNSVKKIRTMFEKGYISKDLVTLGNSVELKNQGKIFSFIAQSMPGYIDLQNENKNGFKYDEIAISDVVLNHVDIRGSMMTIPVTCKNPVRTMKFLELLNTDKYLNNLMVYGIEGYHYDKIDDNTIKLSTKNTGYNNVSYQWAFGNIFENYLLETEDPKRFEKLQVFNDEAKPSKYLGFSPNLEKYKVERTVCNNIIGEYMSTLQFGAGENPEALLDELNEKLKKSGIDEIVADAQRQYDEWKSGSGSGDK